MLLGEFAKRFLSLAAVAATWMISLKTAVFAQTDSPPPATVDIPEALQPAAINELVSKLDAEQVNALTELMRLLNVAAATPQAEAAPQESFLELLKGWASAFTETIAGYFTGIPEMFAGVGTGFGSLVSDRTAGQFGLLVVMLAVAVLAGFAGEFLFNRLSAAKRSQIRGSAPSSLLDTVKMVSSRFLLDAGGLLIFAIVAFVAARLALPDPADRTIVTSIILMIIVLPRFVAAVLRFALAPHRPELRLVTTDDWTANFVYRAFVTMFAFVGVAFFVSQLMATGPTNVSNTFRFFVGFGINAWIIFVIWRARDGFTNIIIGDEQKLSVGLERMAVGWPYFSMIFIALNWLLVQLTLSAGIDVMTPGRSMTVITLVVFAPFLDTMARGIITHLIPPMQGEGPVAEQAHEETRFSYIRIARVVLVATLIFLVGKIYGLSFSSFGGGALGTQIAANSVGFLLILAVGYLAWEICNLWVNRQLAKDSPPVANEDADAEMGGAGKSRIATILPLVRIASQATIITLTVLLALSQIGINITPLLAGAGVLGLAIGFGAQTLVRDVVAGVFFLMDDAFRLGEFIDAGGTQGTIEKISIRSLQLRGTKGAVHIVPYGEIPKLTNLSRDWVIMKLKFTVPFDTDIEKVRKIFKRIGQELLENPDHAENMLAPFKSQGVADVDDVGIVVRGKFTTKPGKQFVIRKEIYAKVQQAFEENGIQFARKEVRIQMPVEQKDDLTDTQKAAVSAAAAHVASEVTTP